MNPNNLMEPDKYQQAWQAHASQTRVTIDAAVLLKEVRRSQLHFKARVFWRDFREVGVGLLMFPYWIYAGLTYALPWTWWLTEPAIVWTTGFVLVDRMRHKRAPSEPFEPLLRTVQESLIQVEHQIWLLRNVFWWYLLPYAIASLAFFGQVTWQVSKGWLEALAGGGSLLVVSLTIYAFIDYINQRAVRVDLDPRRRELLTLLASLTDEPTREPVAISRTKRGDIASIVRRWLIVGLASVATFVAIVLAMRWIESSFDEPPQSSGPAGVPLATLVTDLRNEKGLVGLAAMVTVDGQVEAVAASGERKKGSDVPVDISDRWHLGGITKAITATMIARLIESGQMKWSDSIGESFPDAPIHDDWKPVTLKQLLTDTAGAPANFPLDVWFQRPPPGPERTQARRQAVLNVMAAKPASPPGEKFAYSNVGYTIAGAMAEKATGATWEDLVTREVFEPLQLTGAGFGPPTSPDATLEQPRGHRQGLGGKVAADDKADNSPIMGPACTVHMTLGDLCTFATEHLRGERGDGQLLSADTYKLLHTPELNGYACGWIRKEPSEEIPYTVYWHNGSNTMWYALVAFIPEKNLVLAVTSNDGDSQQAEAAAREILKASVKPINAENERPSPEQP